jgi:hypothetical protein
VNWFATFVDAPTCGIVGRTVNYAHKMDQKFEDLDSRYVDQMGTVIATETINVAFSEGDCKTVSF